MAAGAVTGSDAKGDCFVIVASSDAITIDITTKAASLVAPGIRKLIESELELYDSPPVSVRIEDYGALDYVLKARLETSLRTALPRVKRASRSVDRKETPCDRPRRSRLYAPGSNPRLLVGIEVHGADCVLLDLEDSVPVSEKASARILVKHLLSDIAFPEEVWVRINPLDSEGEEDVREVLRGWPHGLCLPKTETADDVVRLADLISTIEADSGLPEGFVKIMPIIETAKGVLHCAEIASADSRVVMTAFGAEDYTRDVGAQRSRRSLLFARSMLVAACAAAGIQASDTVYADLGDMEGLGKECALARELGFDGKGAINPRQLAVIHSAFSPSEEEMAYALRVVEAAEDAEKSGVGAVALEGKMIDRPVLERAQRLIRYGKRLVGGGDDA